ncbi:hypothetical protein ONE63_008097 [Megalurothrips usitatus]|uniref:Uncharacterized protein n=1 Tax=Megalurothrips usitatus TaxID=439358 RepID=A0AAV7XQU3_9NEOP|nr:hypothetical protein ONE63_008097 [Megalurothrips usitatus]
MSLSSEAPVLTYPSSAGSYVDLTGMSSEELSEYLSWGVEPQKITPSAPPIEAVVYEGGDRQAMLNAVRNAKEAKGMYALF